MGQQFKMLKQLQQMQSRMAKIQEELGSKTVTGTAGGGVVEVVANGHQKVLSVTLKPEVIDPADVEMLQDLVLAAVNDAMDKARELASKEMGAVTAGIGLPPGLMGEGRGRRSGGADAGHGRARTLAGDRAQDSPAPILLYIAHAARVGRSAGV